MLEISTLGGLSIRLNGEPVGDLMAREAQALLVYLVCTRRSLPADVLARLLWGEGSHEQVLTNLYNALADLRQHLGKYIAITGDTERPSTIGPDPETPLWLDVDEMQEELKREQVEQAIELYKGPFLDRFHIPGAVAFGEWVMHEREYMRRLVVDALQGLIAHHLVSGDLRTGMAHASRLLHLDPSLDGGLWQAEQGGAPDQGEDNAQESTPLDARTRWQAEREQAQAERERLLYAAKAQAARQAALFRLSAELAATLDEIEICSRVVNGLKDTLGYDVLAVMLVEESTGDRVLAASVGFDEPITRLRPGEGLSERPLLDGQLHYTPNVVQDPRYFFGMGGSEVDVPIRVGEEILGVLIAESRRPLAFVDDDFEVLTAAAQQAGLAIGKARLLASERKRADELDALRTTLAGITAELELPSLLQAIVERAAALLDATGGEFGLYCPDSQEIEVVVSHNLDGHHVGRRHPLGEGAMGRAAQTREPMIIPDYQTWEGSLPQYQVHSVLVTPIEVGGRLVGIFTTATTDPDRRFTSADLHLLNLFAQQAAVAVENARLYNQAQQEIAERRRVEAKLRRYQEHLEELVAERTAELRESEERYRTLFDGFPVGLYQTTPEGKIVETNPAQVQMLGYPNRETLLATNSSELYADPEDRMRWRAQMERDGIVRDFHTRFRRYDGSTIWVKDTARAVRDSAGTLLHYEGSIEDITQRKLAEEELRLYQENLEELVAERTAKLGESEKRYRSLFDGVPVGLYRTTPDGKLLDVNSALVQMAGFSSPKEFIEFTNLSSLYVDPEERVRWQGLMERDGIVRDFEFEHHRRDGGTIWVSDTARAVKDDQGRVIYYEGSMEDITHRRKLEEDTRRQKEYYEALLVNNPVAVVTADLNGVIVSWNPMAEKLFGHTQEEAIGQYLDDLVAKQPSLRKEASEYSDQVINVGRVQVTTKRTRKDGSLVDVELLALPIVVADEKVGFVAIYHDITERKTMERELRRQKEYYEALFVNNPVAVATVNMEGDVVSWNPAAERLFGYAQEEVMGKNLDSLVASIPWVREEAERYNEQVSTIGRVQATTQRTRRDGSLVDVEVLALPVIVGEERVGYIGIYIDITDLQRARREAEAANQAKSAFLANMSHELRTPLNAILGFTQLMDRDPRVTTDQLEYLGTINRSGEHLLALINDVLEVSKIEAGKMSLQERSCDLYRQLDGLEEMFGLRAHEKGLSLTFTRDENVPQHIEADEGKLGQVLSNLLGNAIKFTQQGSVTLRVMAPASVQPPDPKRGILLFEVEDTGPGIAAEEMPVIFDAFVQSATGRSTQEGTGLGLTISQQFVHLMGGELSVTSQVGEGSCFRFDVQVGLAPEARAEGRLARRRRRVTALAPDLPSFRLLVAEDHETNRQVLVKLLEPVGFEMHEATNGQEAIEVWEDREPHLIWMDMRMPIMDGYEATRRIKATPRGRDTVIIAITASAFEEDREKILSTGCDDFVRKPFREDDIFEMLAKHLGTRYVYEEIEPEFAPKALDRHDPQADEELAGRLAALRPGWLAQLQEATTLGDLNSIGDLINQIGDCDAELGDALATLAYGFEHERMLDLIQCAGEER
jgi:PAS domain S-box-containing protein